MKTVELTGIRKRREILRSEKIREREGMVFIEKGMEGKMWEACESCVGEEGRDASPWVFPFFVFRIVRPRLPASANKNI